MKSPPTPTYFLALLFTGIPPIADFLKHGATYFAELLHYRDAAVAAAAAAGAGPLPVAGPGIMMIIPIIMMSFQVPLASQEATYLLAFPFIQAHCALRGLIRPSHSAPEGRRRCETPFVIDTLCIDTL